ncbi:hypothetical protein A2634_01510 [Candidatus Amesbacteria bacterium RIFCSPHIGHO2_01_FULL_48_32]|uniref:Uncharacterized protein n=1 Tax=Candidatus Amesbacteria bacterium RIFCSPLOWO2_01_FULL_48_25 TaxID=1797259 RepID=A0A1F4ZBH0_9BACT|nr:MAG: hypothetical protein A2634_01510 [Candidatus Amesbacteria bacterium RIFCSPHIGHO2_01_FULL_48_32]OGD03719.1 MAG: hypothetical protein A2989_03495 [Candidatus Amesbacteria bacterium RIFCSPLOWO2_01_FULL_48_25]HJZ05933.1 hypothetical protein [Patescibacteria group bacterium]
MDATILQVPISKALRDKAAKSALSQGFSSLQEAVRVFLNQLSSQAIRVTFEPQPVQLSHKAIRKYNKMSEDVKSGKVKTVGFTDVDEMFKYLNS